MTTRKAPQLIIGCHHNKLCDICNINTESFAIRGKRYVGLWICLNCDTIIQKFLDHTGCNLIRIKYDNGILRGQKYKGDSR